ncbi:MAG TPA: T9SS type A sorting domain-containing protein [Bacteroidales bacterium]|nr:T9SS type A sorting domain-containing protein [Bacteroidales bacterium]
MLPGIITDGLVTNPQSAKSFGVMNAPDARFEPMPDYMMGQIIVGHRILGAKELLKAQIQSRQIVRSKAKAELFRQFLSDTNQVSKADSIIYFLEEETDLKPKYKLALEYTDKGDSTAAYEILENIPVIYSLTDFQQIQHQQYYDLIDITLKVIEETSILPDSIQVATLVSLTNSGIGQIRALARNLLVMADELHYSEPYIIPGNGLKSNNIKRIPVKQNNPEISFTIYPNPATESVWIEFVSNRANVKGFIQLIDLTGKVIKHISIKSWQIKYQLSVSTIKSGMYFIRYLDSEGHIDVQKLIINHE